jgi:hypothetical protein
VQHSKHSERQASKLPGKSKATVRGRQHVQHGKHGEGGNGERQCVLAK